ncbi:Aldo/keto reductase [Marasmius fiardii PR-910]|nr:Aldo/keto reductase [Marasmius fiardii PR-910]
MTTTPHPSQIPKTVNNLTIILGMGSIGDPSNSLVRFRTIESAKSYLSAFAKRGYRQLDSARNYPPGSPETGEPIIGEVLRLINSEERHENREERERVSNGTLFIVDSKLRFAPPNTHRSEMVKKSIEDSFRDLGVQKLHIEYLHNMDSTSDPLETCRAMDEAFKEQKFERFGICNTSAGQLDEFWKACEKQGLTLRPTAYQGDYNVLSREAEEEGIFDKVRKYGMSFYAFSPAGGGVLNSKKYRERGGGRFDENTRMGRNYHDFWYSSSTLMGAAQALRDLSAEHGINGHHLALRWIVWHSKLSGGHGDGIIMGASSVEQLNANLDAIESGPLEEEIVKAIEKVWERYKVEREAGSSYS